MRKKTPCVCEEGFASIGLPGILANGERCDTCERFESDETAALILSLAGTCKALHDALSDILEDCASADREGEIQHVHGNEYEIGRGHRARGLLSIRKSFKALAKAKGK